jgi:hypothetical protein
MLEVKFMLLPTADRQVCPDILTIRQLRICWRAAHSLTEDGSVVYNCFWSSTAHTFSGPSPAGLITIFYCLKFRALPTWRARSPYLYSPGTEWPSPNPRHWVPIFVDSYDLQDPGGGIRTCLQTGRDRETESHLIFKHFVRTSQETHYVSATKPNRLMLFREIITVYCENHTEHTNLL